MSTANHQNYAWRGFNGAGLKAKGTLRAASMQAAKSTLQQQGIVVKHIKKKSDPLMLTEQRIKVSELAAFTRQLSTLVHSGVPLVQALDLTACSEKNLTLRKSIYQLKQDIESGLTFTAALQNQPKHFGGIYTNLIEAGEQAGELDLMLDRLAEHVERIEQMRRKIKKALTYPISVIVVALLVSVAMLVFVVPQFKELFDGFGADLPALTQVIMDMSNSLQEHAMGYVIGVVVFIFGMRFYLKKSEKAAFTKDKLLLKLPIFGKIIQHSIFARYTRTLSTTLSAGMPLIDALKVVEGIANNRLFARNNQYIRDEVSSGTPLNIAVRNSMLFPEIVVQMVMIGEETGALEKMLEKCAENYESKVSHAVDNLSTLMEPLIMLFLAGIVGTMVIALYMPIFQLASVV